EDGVIARDAVGGRVGHAIAVQLRESAFTATAIGPAALAGAGRGVGTVEADETVGIAAVEEGVVHGHGHGVHRVAIDQRAAAVAAVGLQPAPIGPLHQGAIVLGAADHELAIARVIRDALELRGAEGWAVEAGPGLPVVGGFVDPAVIARVDGARQRG